MSINRLKALPSEVLLLVKLTQLKLAANKLESLPSLTALVKLKSVREVASAQCGAVVGSSHLLCSHATAGC